MDDPASEESTWLAQLSLMQKALAALQLPTPPPEEYGKDLVISDDELSGSADSEDLFEDPDDGDDGDFYSSGDNLADGGDINQDWLKRKCTTYCSRHRAYVARSDELETDLIALLGSGNNSMFDTVNDYSS